MFDFFVLFGQISLFLLLMFLFVIVFVYVFSLAQTSISKRIDKETDLKDYVKKISHKEEVING